MKIKIGQTLQAQNGNHEINEMEKLESLFHRGSKLKSESLK